MSIIQIIILVFLALVAVLSAFHSFKVAAKETSPAAAIFITAAICFATVAIIDPSFSVTNWMQPGYEPVVWMDSAFVAVLYFGIPYFGYIILDELEKISEEDSDEDIWNWEPSEDHFDDDGDFDFQSLFEDSEEDSEEEDSVDLSWIADSEEDSEEEDSYYCLLQAFEEDCEYAWKIVFFDCSGSIDDPIYLDVSSYSHEEAIEIAEEHLQELCSETKEDHNMPTYDINQIHRHKVPLDCDVYGEEPYGWDKNQPF